MVWSSEGVVRAVVDMEYVASDELGNLVRLGIVLEVHFTYAVRLVQHVSSKHVQRTLNDVCDSRTRVVSGDGHTNGKFTDSCQ